MPIPLALAVDDDAAILKLIDLSLAETGYRVMTFSDPQEALARLGGGLRPDVIVSDVSMAEMDGFEFCKRVQTMANLDVPFLFLSAMTERSHVRRGMSLGADDYLTKPFAPDDLARAVGVRLQRVQELKRPVEGLIAVTAMARVQVSRDGRLLVWDSQKALELFFYLLENRAGVTTWQVAEALWPGKNEAKASSSFHTTLYRLRKVIGDELVESSNRRYYLHSRFDVHYDVGQYRQLSVRARELKTPAAFEEALAAYRGEFLSGFDSPWIHDMRQALKDEQTAFLLFAAAASLAADKPEAATGFFRRASEHDPRSQAAWQGLGDVLERCGRGREAGEAFERAAALGEVD